MFSAISPTQREIVAAIPGDDIVPNADAVMDRAFTLPGRPDTVWPWFMQLGKNRSGWYLPRWVERVLPANRRALRVIDPHLQNLEVGKVIDDWGGRDATFEIAILEPPNVLVHTSTRGRMHVSCAIALGLEGADHTRVHLRLRLSPVRRKWLVNTVGELIDALTIAGLASGLRERLVTRR